MLISSLIMAGNEEKQSKRNQDSFQEDSSGS
jgi:hypothetical protein